MDETTAANAPDVRAASIGTERVAGDYPLPELGDRAFVADGPIFLDAVLGYARYYATEVIVDSPGLLVVGPPVVILAAAVWAARRRARAQAQAQLRAPRSGR